MKHFLSAIGIFKNEGVIIKEWLDHNIWQGVEHFYLIDNNSDDNFLEIIKPYIDNGLITLYSGPEKYKQVEYYEEIFNIHKNDSEWFVFVDIDEYWFGLETTLKEYLIENGDNFDLLKGYWTIFGSNGYEKQPKEIRTSFTKRLDNEEIINGFILRNLYIVGEKNHSYSKYIVKSSKVVRPHVHTCYMIEGSIEKIEREKININHYQIMSKEYYMNIKMTRGDVKSEQYEQLRTDFYFYERDINQIDNYILCDLVKNGYSK